MCDHDVPVIALGGGSIDPAPPVATEVDSSAITRTPTPTPTPTPTLTLTLTLTLTRWTAATALRPCGDLWRPRSRSTRAPCSPLRGPTSSGRRSSTPRMRCSPFAAPLRPTHLHPTHPHHPHHTHPYPILAPPSPQPHPTLTLTLTPPSLTPPILSHRRRSCVPRPR